MRLRYAEAPVVLTNAVTHTVDYEVVDFACFVLVSFNWSFAVWLFYTCTVDEVDGNN